MRPAPSPPPARRRPRSSSRYARRIDTTALHIDGSAGFRAAVGRAGQLLTITLDRPERLNCQSPSMWDELARLRRKLPDSVRVVVLAATGRAFSAGLDRDLISPDHPDGILRLPSLPEAEATARIEAWQQAFDWTSRTGVVSIAAVQGHAIGGGFQLALGTDIRLAANDVSFRMAEPALGIVPDLGGTKRLVDLVGYSRATEICLTGRPVLADEALRIGLVSSVVADLDMAVNATVDALLSVDRGASTETKALLLRAGTSTQAEQQAAERAAQYRRLRRITGLDAE